MKNIAFLLVLGFVFSQPLFAQEESGGEELDKVVDEKDSGTRIVPKVLDFEAEVIEGERKVPNLFLQMEMNTPSLDAVMYMRKNFNDFHQVELDRKPTYKAPDL